MIRILTILLLITLLTTTHGCSPDKFTPAGNNPVPAGINKHIFDTRSVTGGTFHLNPYLEIYTGKGATPGNAQDTQWEKCNDSIYYEKYLHNEICWFRLTVLHNGNDTFKRLLCFDEFDRVEFDCFSNEMQKAGNRAPVNQWSYSNSGNCVQFKITGPQTRTIYIRCLKAFSSISRPVFFVLQTELAQKAVESDETGKRMADFIFLFFYIGFLFFGFIYSLSQYFNRNRDVTLLVYALYLLFTLLYSFRDVDKHYQLKVIFPLFNGIYLWGEAAFSYLSYIFYSLFVILLLGLKEKRINAYRFISAIIIIISVMLVTDMLIRITGGHATATLVFARFRMMLYPLIIIYFILVMPMRSGYFSYFLWGSVFLLAGSGLNLLAHLLRPFTTLPFHDIITDRYSIWGNAVNYTRMGVIAEVLFFSLGIAKKMRVEFTKAALKEDALIINQFHLHETKSGISVLEQKLENHPEASAYLEQFREYLSKTLELMKDRDGIELNREIEMAEEWFNLQRADGSNFRFSFHNKSGMNPNQVWIPPGLLVPFIQNFFKHAIFSEQKEYRLEAVLYKEGKKINLSLTDNGCGLRDEHVLTKSGSSGLNIVQRKINLFNLLHGARLKCTIKNNPSAPGVVITLFNLPKNQKT